jgi:hypothetical protein
VVVLIVGHVDKVKMDKDIYDQIYYKKVSADQVIEK